MSDAPDYVGRNIESWTKTNAEYTDARAAAEWDAPEIHWGMWHVPERELRALPDVSGKDVIELGCGTAYFSAWLKRAGARRVAGVDVTPAQLQTAHRLNDEHALGLELIEANAEDVPLPDASFDVAVSEYGASIWCDPHKWIPEAARLLRPGGELVFLRTSTLVLLCSPDEGKVDRTLHRPQRGMHRLEWPAEQSVEFHIGHGDMVRLLRSTGFEIVDLIEIFAPMGAGNHAYYDYVTAEWARDWPSEEIWRARRQR